MAPPNKNTEPTPEEITKEPDPNFDESSTQGGEYMDDSLRMKEQPLKED
jgi:hypothetical protein